MLSSCSDSISHRPISLLSLHNLRVSNRPSSFSLCRTSRNFDSNLKLLRKKWKISCFRNEEISSDNAKPEYREHFLQDELVKPDIDQSNSVKRDWGANPREVMLLWVAAFWFTGSCVVPFAAHIAGFNKESLTFRGQALFSLMTDVTEGLAGIAILHRCLSCFQPLPSDWFRFSLKGNWLLDVALGCLMFPLVNRLSTSPYCPLCRLHLSSSQVSSNL